MQGSPRGAVVVDELALVRLGLTGLLRSAGVEVVAGTASGREAGELVRLHEPDLAVIGSPADMPVVEGVRRARAASGSVRILALLGAAQLGGVAGVIEAGADAVELRAARAEDLAAAIDAARAGRRYVATPLAEGLIGEVAPVPPAAGAGDDLLTYREREVLALLAAGASNREIAEALSVTLATVKSHLVHVYAKLEVRNRNEALSRAVGLGLLA